MPFSFKKIEKINFRDYLINILLILVLFSAIYFLRTKFLKETLAEAPTEFKKTRINFDLLEQQKKFLESLYPFPLISKFEGEKGRENPFLPY